MADPLSIYPANPTLRDQWILQQRRPRRVLNAEKPYAFLVEDEHLADGTVGAVATVFLTNRECPWRCAMCDLWVNTLEETVPAGAIPRQIEYALSRLPAAREVKLYNSGSFFDPHAIPTSDYKEIACLLRTFERVIVESHPSLVGKACFQFQQLLDTKLEVAMGLETAHPGVLEKLNKRMTLGQYTAAAEKLQTQQIDLRSFILVQPPFMAEEDSVSWASRSVDFAFRCGATAISLIPTRAGNGAMEKLAAAGDFVAPRLAAVEQAMDYGFAVKSGRVFVDFWDINKLAAKPCCRDKRLQRLRTMNLSQQRLPAIACEDCAGRG